ncbi:hypothetical protein QYE76_054110 [Lolium multiflorum]|uniref:Uncharacterized protein n=1 Tax=Lolium multiflorum TaxID=4521 RepID=A0AAD8WL23_LOLMU|nr:hypothetical protein QYE76_054110 [Lolium multiflorum]
MARAPVQPKSKPSSSKRIPRRRPPPSAMAPPQHDPRRPYKRATISDQQRRRDSMLRTQYARRADSQARARSLANSLPSPASSSSDDQPPTSPEAHGDDPAVAEVATAASKLREPRPAPLVRPPDHAPGVDGRRPSPPRPRLDLLWEEAELHRQKCSSSNLDSLLCS